MSKGKSKPNPWPAIIKGLELNETGYIKPETLHGYKANSLATHLRIVLNNTSNSPFYIKNDGTLQVREPGLNADTALNQLQARYAANERFTEAENSYAGRMVGKKDSSMQAIQGLELDGHRIDPTSTGGIKVASVFAYLGTHLNLTKNSPFQMKRETGEIWIKDFVRYPTFNHVLEDIKARVQDGRPFTDADNVYPYLHSEKDRSLAKNQAAKRIAEATEEEAAVATEGQGRGKKRRRTDEDGGGPAGGLGVEAFMAAQQEELRREQERAIAQQRAEVEQAARQARVAAREAARQAQLASAEAMREAKRKSRKEREQAKRERQLQEQQQALEAERQELQEAREVLERDRLELEMLRQEAAELRANAAEELEVAEATRQALEKQRKDISRLRNSAQNTMEEAEEWSQECRAAAEHEAATIVQNGRTKAEEQVRTVSAAMLEDARAEAEAIRNQAREEVKEIVENAKRWAAEHEEATRVAATAMLQAASFSPARSGGARR